MPRPKRNPYQEGTEEYEARRLELVEQDKQHTEAATERRLTVTLSIASVNAAKALGTLSGMNYRDVLSTAAQNGVDALVQQVQHQLVARQEQDGER